MLTRMPETVQQAWGEVAARDFTVWMEDVMSEQTVRRDEWGQVKVDLVDLRTGLDVVRERLTNVEARLTNVETRLTNVETRLTIIEHEVAELKIEMREFRREVNERFDRMGAMFNDRIDRLSTDMNARIDRLQQQILVQTRWSIGILALFCTITAALIGIAQLRP